uniref:Uncharacterized protein n=1 Tax=Hemiselmis andersenii TaxID=464988 RepID=A0A6U2I0M2_HEMAN|mmetsp:Transcript_43065/g.100004  ORF Transcript_43065/g.100004 Transcript_43065/m.100004 type:complete len:159 (+) Transcript_43065:376-852(+)
MGGVCCRGCGVRDYPVVPLNVREVIVDEEFVDSLEGGEECRWDPQVRYAGHRRERSLNRMRLPMYSTPEEEAEEAQRRHFQEASRAGGSASSMSRSSTGITLYREEQQDAGNGEAEEAQEEPKTDSIWDRRQGTVSRGSSVRSSPRINTDVPARPIVR